MARKDNRRQKDTDQIRNLTKKILLNVNSTTLKRKII